MKILFGIDGIVAEGAEKVNVKLNILSAVETVLEVDRNKITILS